MALRSQTVAIGTSAFFLALSLIILTQPLTADADSSIKLQFLSTLSGGVEPACSML